MLVSIGKFLSFLVRFLSMSFLVAGLIFILVFDIVFGALSFDLTLKSLLISTLLSLGVGAVVVVTTRLHEIIEVRDRWMKKSLVAVGVAVRLLDSLIDSLFFFDQFSRPTQAVLPHYAVIRFGVVISAFLISLVGEQLAIWVVKDDFRTVFDRLLGINIQETRRAATVGGYSPSRNVSQPETPRFHSMGR